MSSVPQACQPHSWHQLNAKNTGSLQAMDRLIGCPSQSWAPDALHRD